MSFEEKILDIHLNRIGGKWYSMDQIGRMLGCNSGTVRYYLKKHNLQTMSQILYNERLTKEGREALGRTGMHRIRKQLIGIG